MENQQGPAGQHRALCSMSRGSLAGRGVWGTVVTCICLSPFAVHLKPSLSFGEGLKLAMETWKSRSPVRLFATILSMGFSRPENWSGLPCPPPGDLPHPGVKPGSPASAGGFFILWATRTRRPSSIAHGWLGSCRNSGSTWEPFSKPVATARLWVCSFLVLPSPYPSGEVLDSSLEFILTCECLCFPFSSSLLLSSLSLPHNL